MSEPARVPDLLETPDAVETAPELRVVSSSQTPKAARWWRIADFGVFAAWIGVVAFTLRYHEKWADEAQAWLIARDLDLKTIWFHELRYEGSPGLWHTILWVAQHVFHARYDALGYIGVAGATAGVALLIFKAPFPRYIRWPLAFTYFMVYQYAVIARPYTLLPLLAFSAALLFKDLEHPERMTAVLALLANLSLHGTILAACLGMVYLMDAYRARATLDARVKRHCWICIGVMAAVFVFIVLILKPTPDVGEFAKRDAISKMPAAIQAMQPHETDKVGVDHFRSISRFLASIGGLRSVRGLVVFPAAAPPCVCFAGHLANCPLCSDSRICASSRYRFCCCDCSILDCLAWSCGDREFQPVSAPRTLRRGDCAFATMCRQHLGRRGRNEKRLPLSL